MLINLAILWIILFNSQFNIFFKRNEKRKKYLYQHITNDFYEILSAFELKLNNYLLNYAIIFLTIFY